MKEYQRILVEAYEKTAAAPYTMSGAAKKLQNIKKYFNAPSRLESARQSVVNNVKKTHVPGQPIRKSKRDLAFELSERRADMLSSIARKKRRLTEAGVVGAVGSAAGAGAHSAYVDSSQEKNASVQDVLNYANKAGSGVLNSAKKAGSYVKKQITAESRAKAAARHAAMSFNNNARVNKLLQIHHNVSSTSDSAILGGLLGFLGGNSVGHHTSAGYSSTNGEKTASFKDMIAAAKSGAGKAYDATKAGAGKAYDATKAGAAAGAAKAKTNLSKAVDAVKKIPSTQTGKENLALGAGAAGLGTIGYQLGKSQAKRVNESK